MTLNEQISKLNKQLSKEKSTVSFLLEEKKRLMSDFKSREDELLDKQILHEKKIKELNNIVLKMGQSIQTIHMLSPKPNLFYHTEQKMALGYQNPFYLKQAQKKQQSLYDGKVLLAKHDPIVVHDSEETLQLAQESAGSESRPPILNKENYVSWSSRLLRYAKSRPNGKLIRNSILNGPYVRKMIPELGDANCEITVTETFHLKTDDELSDKELKQIEADDQSIQTILLGLPEDIYAAVDSCETVQEIWL
nr:hypothetical protein [Tanacetum cinerariifolium]